MTAKNVWLTVPASSFNTCACTCWHHNLVATDVLHKSAICICCFGTPARPLLCFYEQGRCSGVLPFLCDSHLPQTDALQFSSDRVLWEDGAIGRSVRRCRGRSPPSCGRPSALCRPRWLAGSAPRRAACRPAPRGPGATSGRRPGRLPVRAGRAACQAAAAHPNSTRLWHRIGGAAILRWHGTAVRLQNLFPN